MKVKFDLLFEPDVLIGAQYLANSAGKNPVEPERMLMLAILEDALTCFRSDVGTTDRQSWEAEKWMLEKDGNWLYSFENICEVLGLSPRWIRQRLLRWKEEKLERGLPNLPT